MTWCFRGQLGFVVRSVECTEYGTQQAVSCAASWRRRGPWDDNAARLTTHSLDRTQYDKGKTAQAAMVTPANVFFCAEDVLCAWTLLWSRTHRLSTRVRWPPSPMRVKGRWLLCSLVGRTVSVWAMFPAVRSSILYTRRNIHIHIGNPGMSPGCPLTTTRPDNLLPVTPRFRRKRLGI